MSWSAVPILNCVESVSSWTRAIFARMCVDTVSTCGPTQCVEIRRAIKIVYVPHINLPTFIAHIHDDAFMGVRNGASTDV